MLPAASNGKPIEPTIRSSARSGTASAPVRVLGEPRPVRELALELLARVGERGSAGSRRLRDRRQGVQRDAESGRQGRATHTAGVDDHELLSLHETEGAADGAEERRHALDERVRHLVGCRGGGKLRGQRSESVRLGFDLVRRSARLTSRSWCARSSRLLHLASCVERRRDAEGVSRAVRTATKHLPDEGAHVQTTIPSASVDLPGDPNPGLPGGPDPTPPDPAPSPDPVPSPQEPNPGLPGEPDPTPPDTAPGEGEPVQI